MSDDPDVTAEEARYRQAAHALAAAEMAIRDATFVYACTVREHGDEAAALDALKDAIDARNKKLAELQDVVSSSKR